MVGLKLVIVITYCTSSRNTKIRTLVAAAAAVAAGNELQINFKSNFDFN